MNLDGTDYPPCGPGYSCPTRFVGCQSVCPKMIIWKERQERTKEERKSISRGAPGYSPAKAHAARRALMEKKGGR